MTISAACATTVRFSPSRYTGKERDTESGNDYFDARYYSSAMGRFMSPDDGSDQSPSNPQSWDLYSYGRNNPLIGIDPDGHVYTVCPAGGGACTTGIHDDTFEAEQKSDRANGVVYANGTISQRDANGNMVAVGTYQQTSEDAPGLSGPANLAGIHLLAQTGATVGPIAGVEMAVISMVMPGMFAADAAPAAAGLAGVGRTGGSAANRLNHIFGKAKHNLEGVVQACGGRQGAYDAMVNATEAATRGTTGQFEVTVQVGGQNVVVRGAVIDGTVKISTAFKP